MLNFFIILKKFLFVINGSKFFLLLKVIIINFINYMIIFNNNFGKLKLVDPATPDIKEIFPIYLFKFFS
jgi:hypothetical protein